MAELHFPFVAGADESKSSKLQALPRLKRAENWRWAEQNTLRKRFGTESYADGTPDDGTPVGPVRLARHGGQTLVLGEDSLFTIGADGDRLEQIDGLPRTTLQGVTPLAHYIHSDVLAVGSAQTESFRVWAWVMTSSGFPWQLHIQVFDIATGATQSATKVPIANPDEEICNFKVIRVSDKVTVFWAENGGQIMYLDITSGTAGPYTSNQGTELVAASAVMEGDDQFFDVTPNGSGYFLTFMQAGSPDLVFIRRYNAAHAQQASNSFSLPAGGGGSYALAIASVGTGACVVMGCDDPSAALELIWVNASCALSDRDTYTAGNIRAAGDVVTAVTACNYNGTTVAFGFTAETSGGVEYCRFGTHVLFGAITLTVCQAKTSLASDPWVYRGDVYSVVRRWVSQANSYMALVRHSPGADSLVAIAEPYLECRFRDGRAKSTQTNQRRPNCGVAFDGNTAHVGVIAVDRYSNPNEYIDPTGLTAIDSDGSAAVGNQAIDVLGADGFAFCHNDRARWQTATAGDYTAIAGGVLAVFDGLRVNEIGFASLPEATYTPSTGGSMDAGTYQYATVWEHIDALGNRAQSAAWLKENVVVSATGTVTVAGIWPTPHTLRRWSLAGDDTRYPSAAIYSSAAGGTTLQRLEGSGVPRYPVDIGASVTATVVSALDNFVDNDDHDTIGIIGRELLYTTQFGANELQNMMPPASAGVCVHEGRIVSIDAENRTSVIYTKVVFPGTAPSWNNALRMQFDEPCTALASQDGNLLVFTATSIYTVTGVGLDNLGRNGGYNAPQLLSAHAGCVNWRSLCATPVGLFFESARGIELLQRGGGSPTFIGDGIRDTRAQFSEVSASLHIPARSEVWFACIDRFGTEWDPTTVSGCIAWFDVADPDARTVVAGKVSDWENKVTGVNASQATAASRPRIEVVNGRPWMRFAGSQTSAGISTPAADAHFFRSAETALAEAFRAPSVNKDFYTAFVLWPMSTAGSWGTIWGAAAQDESYNGSTFSQNITGYRYQYATVGPGSPPVDSYCTSELGERVAPALFEVYRDDATMYVYINGVLHNTAAASGSQSVAFDSFVFGKMPQRYTYCSPDCRLGDFVAYSRVPTEAERDYIRAGLAAKLGMGETLDVPTREAETGRVLVWDYRMGTWIVRNYQGKPVTSLALEPGDTAVAGSGRVVLGVYDDASGCTLWREDAGHDDADASHISTVLETGDIRLKGAQGGAAQMEASGLQNVRAITLLGEVHGTPKLLVEESVNSGVSWTSKTAIDLAESEHWAWRYQTRLLRGGQHRYRITEQEGVDGTDVEGVAVTLMSLDVSTSGGASRVLPANRG